MRRLDLMLVAGAAATLTTGCAMLGYGPPPPPRPVVIPQAYALGDVIGGRKVRAQKLRKAGIRPLGPTQVAYTVGRQELALRQQTAGTGVDVIRQGNELMLRMPSSVTFAPNSSALNPQFGSTLGEVARSLKAYPASMVDVLGHTDSTGTPAANQALSLKRADTVAAALASRGVQRVRLATRGYAATKPLGDNSTEDGRALNRRVEIRIVPLTTYDVR